MALEDYLYLYTNVGINGFQPDADHLYQYTNLVAGAPCPFVSGTDQEIATANQPLTIFGRGFEPSPLDTGPEARAYSGPLETDPFVVMGTLTAWTDTQVTVSVPPGLSNPSYIRVVHTGPDATTLCTGSNLVYQMVAPFAPIDADPEAGWWVEAWDLDNASPILRGLPVIVGSGQRILNDIGDGTITLPAPDPTNPEAWNRHREICDPPNNITTLLKVYIDGRYAGSFWADQISDPYGEPSEQVVDIAGKGIEGILEWARLYPHDYDAAAPLADTLFPDWNYGYSLTYLENFEEADTTPPDWEARNGGLESAITPGETIITPTGVHSGLQRTYEIEGEEGATFLWSLEVLGSVDGMRVTAGADIGDTAEAILSANTFLYNGEYLSELGNVPSTGTGCPGGSTDDIVWKTVEVELEVPEGTKSVTVFIQADHHASCGAPGNQPFTVRNVTFQAAGTNTPEGWSATHADIFEVRATYGKDGTNGLVLTGSTEPPPRSVFTTVEVAVEPGVPTTFLAEVQTLDIWLIEAVDPETQDILHTTAPEIGNSTWQLRTLEWTPEPGRTSAFLRVVFPTGQGGIDANIDNVAVATGLQPATPGKIAREMVEAAQARGTITQVELDFTDANDSDGNLWTRVVAINFGHGQTIWEAMAQLAAQGFELEVAPRFYTIGGDQGIVFSLYNGRSQGPSYGVGDNQELTRPDTAVAIREGQIMDKGESTQTIPRNVTFAEGAASPTGGTQVSQAQDTAAITGSDRREDFFTNAQVLDAQTLQDTAVTRLDNIRKQATAATVELLQASPYVPNIDFNLGDSIIVDLGETIPEDWYRAARIGWSLEEEGDVDLRYVVDIGTVVVPEDAVVAVTLARLVSVTQAQGGPGTGTSTDVTSGSPGSPIIIPSQAVPPHGHNYGDINPAGLSGDLAGTNPQPRVSGLQGTPVAVDTPAAGNVLGYDADAGLWALQTRMDWRGAWLQGTYLEHDVVRDGAWTMVANKVTDDEAAPQPVSIATWLYDDDPTWAESTVSDTLTFGTRIHSLTTTYYAEAIRVWIPDLSSTTVYQLVVVDNNTGAIDAEAPFEGVDVPAIGWFTIGRPVVMGPGDDFSFLLLQHSNITLTPTTEPWVWTGTSNQEVDPGTGNINTRTNGRILRINDIDDNSVDQSTLLGNVTPGTIVTVTQQSDANKSITFLCSIAEDQIGYWTYATIVLAEGSSGIPDDDALCDVEFENPQLDPMEKRTIVDQWVGNAQVDGVYAEGTATPVFDDDGYGVDVFYQEYEQSPDWDIVAVSAVAGAFGGGGGAGGGHEIQDDGTPLPQQPALDFVGFNVYDDLPNTATVVESVAQGGPVRMSKAYLDSDYALGVGWFKVPATTLHPDAREDWRDGSGGLVAPVDGVYVVSGQIPFQDYNVADFPIAILSTNGIPPAAGAAYIGWIQRLGLIAAGGGTSTLPFSRVFTLNAGDVVQMNVNDGGVGGNVRGEPIATAYNAATLELTLLEVDADGLEISGKIDLSVDTALLSVGANHVIPFDRALIDIGGITNLGINGFTVPAGFGGTYVLNVNPQVGTGPGGGPIDDTRVEVLVNGLTAGAFAGRGRVQGRDFSQTQTAPVMLQLAAGDQVTFTHFIGAGAPYALRGNASPISATKCEAWLFRLTGASTIPDDLTYLRLDGTNAMTGDLDMGDNDIVDLANDPLPYSQQIIAAPAGWLGDIVVTQSGRTLQLLVRMIRTTDVTINGPLNLVTTTLQPNNATYFVCATSQYNTQIRTPSSASLVWQTDGKVTLINRIVGANALRGEAIGMLDVNMQ